MRILVTGANGLLGQKIVEKALLSSEIELIATSRGENRNRVTSGYQYIDMDISHREAVFKIAAELKPDVMINTAAMTHVDECEKEREKCWAANVTAVQHLADAAKEFGIHLVHLSTDFVFDGENGPYTEKDQPNPLSYYGQSKYEAEKLVMNAGLKKWSIARTIIVFGVGHQLSRGNIVLWVKDMLEQGKEIKIVNDQFRSPTLAEDLAEGCLRIALKGATGIFHLSGPETFSIYDLALKVAEYYNLNKKLVIPVRTGEFVQPAKRPLRTGFIIDKARKELGYDPHYLNESLEIITEQLGEAKVDH